MACEDKNRFQDADALVLILVLVEDGLRDYKAHKCDLLLDSLNPCFSGRWSARDCGKWKEYVETVLILVLVEDGLRV